ncbi:MAG: hypothetical protein JRF33_00500 [Deltaproteobacteria bacterium]|nr:hypothetical protein [Deltaproteobacteria bacterium]
MNTRLTLALIAIFSLLLAAPVVSAQDVIVQVVLKKAQRNNALAQEAKKLFDAALNKRGIQAKDGVKSLDWEIVLEVVKNRSSGGKSVSVTLNARAHEAGNRGRMGGMATGMTQPFPLGDKPAEAKALQEAVDKMADELAAQLKKAAQHAARRGKVFDIHLTNAPNGYAPIVHRALKRMCSRVKAKMMGKNQGSFTCTSKEIKMSELEASLGAALGKKFPGKSYKMEKKGQLLIVVFE